MNEISGKSVYTGEELNNLLLKNNPNPKLNGMNSLNFCKIYISEGELEGIRGDIAFCQAVKETGWFKYGGQVLPEQNNYCGLGALNQYEGQTGKGAWFKNQQEGIRAHIQHLKAYANKEPLKSTCVDPRFTFVTRGIAPLWTDLNGKWAVPGVGYGEAILAIANQIVKITTNYQSLYEDLLIKYNAEKTNSDKLKNIITKSLEILKSANL